MYGQLHGISTLKQIMVRVAKGEAAMRLEIWRTAMQDEAWAGEMAHLEAELEARAAGVIKVAALRLVKQIFVRLMKGGVVMRLEVLDVILCSVPVALLITVSRVVH